MALGSAKEPASCASQQSTPVKQRCKRSRGIAALPAGARSRARVRLQEKTPPAPLRKPLSPKKVEKGLLLSFPKSVLDHPADHPPFLCARHGNFTRSGRELACLSWCFF